MFEAKNIHVSYGKSKVINDFSLQIPKGGKTAILGRNGVGKTTFLKSVMGLLPISSGSIVFDGTDITNTRTYKRSLKGLGYVPQGREIIPLLSVNKNLELGAMGHKNIKLEEKKEWVLSFFPALKVHMNRNGGLLSGGLQQQLAIARCLMGNTKMILLDEPTEGIQPNVILEISETLKKIVSETGITIAVVEQNLRFAKSLADEYIIVQKGTVAAKGNMNELNDEIIKKYLTV